MPVFRCAATISFPHTNLPTFLLQTPHYSPLYFLHSPTFLATMRQGFRAVAALLAATTLVSTVDAISKITRSGRYLYDDSGNRFYIKGIAYQEQGAQMCFDHVEPFLRRTPSQALLSLALTMPSASLRASLTPSLMEPLANVTCHT